MHQKPTTHRKSNIPNIDVIDLDHIPADSPMDEEMWETEDLPEDCEEDETAGRSFPHIIWHIAFVLVLAI